MRLARKGIPVIAAAGNRGRDVGDTCPANVNAYRVYTVGSINWKDKYMGYSNFGSAVDFAAPGHGILSTFKDGKYAYMSGTSMAAPHAAAVIFLGRGYYSTSGRTWAKNRYIDIISQ
ncbi:MAG: S8 family serine peptidase, partial [Bacteroidota bacterium]